MQDVRASIGWATHSWNPIHGCTRGCPYCFARKMAKRLAAMGVDGYDPADPFRPTFHPGRLGEPLKRKKPARIFVCSMGDFCDPAVERDWQREVLNVVSQCERHKFLFLTKRPQDLRVWDWSYWPNAWLGATVTNQADTDARVPELLRTPAAGRFVSCEPLLGPVDLRLFLTQGTKNGLKEQRRHCSSSNCTRGTGDRRGRSCLENPDTPRQQVDRHGPNVSLSSTPSREQSRTISSSQSDGRQKAHVLLGPSPSVAPLRRADSAWHDDQSQERHEEGQSARESGVSDTSATVSPCPSRSPQGENGSERREECDAQTDRAASAGDPSFVPNRSDGGGQTAKLEPDESGQQVRCLSRHHLEGCYRSTLDIGFVIIGADSTPGAAPPQREWVDDLLAQADAAGVPAYIKDNLTRHYPDLVRREWPRGLMLEGEADGE